MKEVLKCKMSDNRESTVYFTDTFLPLFSSLEENGDSYIIICDENTASYSFNKEKTVVLKSGEENKNVESLASILDFAILNNLGRDSFFIAIGGGVICDMTSLASSLYMRGARVVLCPTTLLAMVDATLGGKTAIDYKNVKNIIGTFHPAESIYINFSTLNSLSSKEFLCGMGEVVKHAFLSSSTTLYNLLFNEKDRILDRDAKIIEEIVYQSLLVKKDYIERDPKEESGIRSSLNLGHTFAHSLESISSYAISHGEAVVWGMKRAFTASLLLGLIDNSYYLYAISLISLYPFSTNIKIEKKDHERFLSTIKKDKKKKNGRVLFVLPTGEGRVELKELTDEQIMLLL